MNDFFSVIRARHSYRGAFLPTPVSRDTLTKIIDAGRAAPSGCNKQSARFIVIDEPAVMNAVRQLLSGPAVDTAQAFILVVFDPSPAYENTNFGAEDCAAAVTNMLNAITALGLATVWLDGAIRGDTANKLGALLNIPAPLTARILLPLGVPAKPGVQPARKPAEQRVGWNTFTPDMK